MNDGPNTNGSLFLDYDGSLTAGGWLRGVQFLGDYGMEVIHANENVRTNKTDKPFEGMRIVDRGRVRSLCGVSKVDFGARSPNKLSRYCGTHIHIHICTRTSGLHLTLVSSELSGRKTRTPFLQIMKTNQRAETNFSPIVGMTCWSSLYGSAPASS